MGCLSNAIKLEGSKTALGVGKGSHSSSLYGKHKIRVSAVGLEQLACWAYKTKCMAKT